MKLKVVVACLVLVTVKIAHAQVITNAFSPAEEACVRDLEFQIRDHVTAKAYENLPIFTDYHKDKRGQKAISDKGTTYSDCASLKSIFDSFTSIGAEKIKANIQTPPSCVGAEIDTLLPKVISSIQTEITSMPKKAANPDALKNTVTDDNYIVVFRSKNNVIDQFKIADYIKSNADYDYILSSLTPNYSSLANVRNAFPINLTCWTKLKRIRQINVVEGQQYVEAISGFDDGLAHVEANPDQKIFAYHCDADGNKIESSAEFVKISDLKFNKHAIFADQMYKAERAVRGLFYKTVPNQKIYSIVTQNGFYYLWNKDSNDNRAPFLLQAGE